MRRAEPLEPEVEAALEAIDATLAGDPVDPEHAELAELSLILRSDRPAVRDSFAAAMDARVGERFAPPSAPGAPARTGWRRLWPTGTRSGWLAPAGVVAGLIAAVVVFVSVTGGGRPSSSADLVNSVNGSASSASSAGSKAASGGGSSSAGSGAKVTSAAHPPRSAPGAESAPVPSNGSGRQIALGAQLSLSTRPGRINALSQQVFDLIGNEKGYVASSSVTATGHPDSSATFTLSVPNARLQETLTRLSQLPGSAVVSSTNTSRDITGAVGGAGRRLAEARALRRSLLHQLAAAVTSDQIDTLNARIARVDRTIDRDQAALGSLHQQVRFSRIALTIQGTGPPASGKHHAGGGGFTLRRAGHDAVHVLVVAAGVLLIALAVAIPVGLVAALVSWLWLRTRRKARESALDRA